MRGPSAALAATHALAGGDDATDTGWAGWSTTPAGAGAHTAAFGIVDVGSASNTSRCRSPAST